MTQNNNKESQLRDIYNKSTLLGWALWSWIIFIILMGVWVGFSQKEISRFKKTNEEMAILLTSAEDSKFSTNQNNPGNFVILRPNTISITFNDFEGELIWYTSDYEGNNFHSTRSVKIEDGKPIQVPENTHAFLKTGQGLKKTYSMDFTTSTKK